MYGLIWTLTAEQVCREAMTAAEGSLPARKTVRVLTWKQEFVRLVERKPNVCNCFVSED